MENVTLLVMHDTRVLSSQIDKTFSNAGFKVISMPTRRLNLLDKALSADCAVVVLESDDASGCPKIIERIKDVDENLPVIIVSRSRRVEDAVMAMRAGAYDYISYPGDPEKLKISIGRAKHFYDLTKRVYLLENQVGWRGAYDNIVGQSREMQEIFGVIEMVAKSNATVLVTGESGTGKELIAQAIHRHSLRNKAAFIDINCGAIPHELLENELFGHERGAYTGADKRYAGSCERADGGTLFLDEISEMDPLLQVKLLRFLQERTFTRVGGNEAIRVDARIIAATNKDIAAEVGEGRFREDLYYRLNVVPIHIPPLRNRRDDIPLLAKHFLEKYSTKNEKIFLDFAPQTVDLLMNYDWPGNVRELENAIERTVVLHNDSRVKVSHLPPAIQQGKVKPTAASASDFSMAPLDGQRIVPLDLVEKYAIEAALRRCLGNVTEAARKLKVGQATLYRKIRQFGLR